MFYEIELYDNVTYQAIEPLELPEVLIPEDFDIWVNQKESNKSIKKTIENIEIHLERKVIIC